MGWLRRTLKSYYSKISISIPSSVICLIIHGWIFSVYHLTIFHHNMLKPFIMLFFNTTLGRLNDWPVYIIRGILSKVHFLKSCIRKLQKYSLWKHRKEKRKGVRKGKKEEKWKWEKNLKKENIDCVTFDVKWILKAFKWSLDSQILLYPTLLLHLYFPR